MKTNKTELVFLLDRSGSMAGLEEDTIGGYVFGLLGRKPEIGDAVEISGYSFKVLRTEGFRVVRVLAAKLPQEQEQKEEQQDE